MTLSIKHVTSYTSSATGLIHGYLVEGEYDGLAVCEAVESYCPPMAVTVHDALASDEDRSQIIETAISRARMKFEKNNRPTLTLTMQNDQRSILAQLGIDENPPIYRNK